MVNVSDEIARPSSGLVNAIEELAHDLHPEAFSTPGARYAPGLQKSAREFAMTAVCGEELAACAR